MSSSGDDDSLQASHLNSGSESCSQTADHSQNSNKSKHPKEDFCAWSLRFSLQIDLLSIQGFDVDEQKRRIAKHLPTRLDHHNQQHSILTVFCDFKLVVVPPQDE